MHLQRLELEEFRLYHRVDLALSPSGLAITGDNASGKSTIIEAIALLATLRSPRTGSDRELIGIGSGRELGVSPYARVRGELSRIDDGSQIEVGLQVDDEPGSPLRKLVRVNGRPVRALDAVGTLKVVLFAPEDVALASGSPSQRRRYLDVLLSQIDRGYVRSLAKYNRIIEQRNSLLRQLQKSGAGEHDPETLTQLTFWDEELVVLGARLTGARMLGVRRLAQLAGVRFDVFGSGKSLSVAYLPSVGSDLLASDYGLEALEARLALLFGEKLRQTRRDELRRGVTLTGPHRDDISLKLDGLEVGVYGSRGQQRLTLVALKLAEADLMTERAGESPVVLLDDVLSELDVRNRDLLLAALAEGGDQIVVTAADPELLAGPQLRSLPRISVRAGEIAH